MWGWTLTRQPSGGNPGMQWSMRATAAEAPDYTVQLIKPGPVEGFRVTLSAPAEQLKGETSADKQQGLDGFADSVLAQLQGVFEPQLGYS